MARFRILSWNIESFGEKKLGPIGDYVARVIDHANADLVLIIETTTYSPVELLPKIAEGLVSLKPSTAWYGFPSDPTGKRVELPDEILVADWPRRKTPASPDLPDYEPTLLKCYAKAANPARYELKPIRTEQDETDVGRALEQAGIVRPDMETYSALFRYDPKLHDTSRSRIAVGSYVGLNSPAPAQLVGVDTAGNLIDFPGRKPFVVNLFFRQPQHLAAEGWQSNDERYFPVVCFHAPFDKNDWRVQSSADVSLLELGVLRNVPQGTGVKLASVSDAVIAADFNISLDLTDYSDASSNTQSGQTYGALYGAGFVPTIREPTTLTTLAGGAKLSPTAASTEFRVNAYDNVLLQAGRQPIYSKPHGAALDLVAHTLASATDTNHYLHAVTGGLQLQTVHDAFQYVRTTISDHLPVLCELTVPDRP
jgi:hypothetical protein